MQINGTTPTNFQSPKNNPTFGMEFSDRVAALVKGPLLKLSEETLDQIKVMHDHVDTDMFICDCQHKFLRGWRIFIENTTRPSQNTALKGLKSLSEGLRKLIPHLGAFRKQHDLANELETSKKVLDKSLER